MPSKKKYEDLPEYIELTKLLRSTWDFRTANKFLKLFAEWQDVLTATDGPSILDSVFVVEMIKTPDVTGGGTTAEVGFQLRDLRGDKPSQAGLVQFLVSQDVDSKTPAVCAKLGGTPTAGTLVDGADTPALLTKTDATGLFKCTITDLLAETVHLSCDSAPGGPVLSCKAPDGAHSLTFS